MGKVTVGINLEYARSGDKSFEWSMDKAADMGFEFVEPMVHWGRELLSAAGYFHTVSMLDDPYRVRAAAEKNGLKISVKRLFGMPGPFVTNEIAVPFVAVPRHSGD